MCEDAGGETSVIEHQTAVQGTGGGTHGSTHESGCDACASAVASCNGTQAGSESHTVDVSLSRDGPAHFTAVDVAEKHGDEVEQLVSGQDRPDVSRVLSHAGEGHGSQHYADGGTGEANALRIDHDHIQIQKETGSYQANVDETDRHAVLGGEITLMTGVPDQLSITLETFAI